MISGPLHRAVDVILSASLLVALAPVFLLVSTAIWVSMGRPIFYPQYRGGVNGLPFRMYKFRTMRGDAESGGSLTVAGDARITPLGALLRQYKLDELPQLANILLGEMKFIGPRPEVLDWIAQYSPAEREVLRARPGLTDPVQILFRHEHDHLEGPDQYRELMREKVRRQLEYLSKRTLWTDIKVVVATARCVFNRHPSHEELQVYEDCRRKAHITGEGCDTGRD
jgi:lipopolysaccharide/colanic/teichoic acid biosynthesis glycosyltransferase